LPTGDGVPGHAGAANADPIGQMASTKQIPLATGQFSRDHIRAVVEFRNVAIH
jgi:hypothetical protein